MLTQDLFLPVTDNGGADMTPALHAFEAAALDLAGGFTDMGQVNGAWASDGCVYRDTNRIYRVAANPTVWERLLTRASELWPDQEAIAYQEAGPMHFRSRQQAAA